MTALLALGLAANVAGRITMLLIGALAATGTHAWHDIAHFFTALSAAGLTGLLAALAPVREHRIRVLA